MVNLTSFLMIYTFIKLSLIIKELEANEISTLKSLWCILNSIMLRAHDMKDISDNLLTRTKLIPSAVGSGGNSGGGWDLADTTVPEDTEKKNRTYMYKNSNTGNSMYQQVWKKL